MQKKGWLFVAVAFVLGATLAWAQSSFPVRLDPWEDEPQPLIPGVAAAVVTTGGIGLVPDTLTTTSVQGGSGAGKKVLDDTCDSEAERGEIRLWSLTEAGVGSFDAFCFCQAITLTGQTTTYAWSCFKTQ